MTMAIIQALPEHLINQIAAGEVVENPASAVKELVENSIDAGARHISVEIEQGGKSLIRVSDDGIGMEQSDLVLSLQRHATSKLDDHRLDHITSLGFRGEAMPSIASVSRMVMTSKHQTEDSGWSISVEAGQPSSPQPASRECGTVVEVKDLFYATPARLKFLKSDNAETLAIKDIIRRLALSKPDIGFDLSVNGKTAMHYKAQDTLLGDSHVRRIQDVIGTDFADNAMPVDTQREGLRLYGYAGLPTFHAKQANKQWLFVNGRPVRDRMLTGVLRAAYGDTLFKGQYPVACLFIECDPEWVDVNVHPAKTEVRFQNPQMLRGLIISTIQQAIHSQASHTSTDMADKVVQISAARQSARPVTRVSEPVVQSGWSMPPAARKMEPSLPTAPEEGGEVAEEICVEDFPLGAAKAQCLGNYIVAETQDGIILVDQHAAHERIVYEDLKQGYQNRNLQTQPLLIPETVEMEADDVTRIIDAADVLKEAGLVVESFGADAVIVREVPMILSDKIRIHDLLTAIANDLESVEMTNQVEERILALLSTMACHSSVRSGRIMRQDDMNALLRRMEKTPRSGQCNHGRPTYIKLELRDIERLFARA